MAGSGSLDCTEDGSAGLAESALWQHAGGGSSIGVPTGGAMSASETWPNSPSVIRWRRALLEWVGVDQVEVRRRVDAFLDYCSQAYLAPDALVERAAEGDAVVRTILSVAEEHTVRVIVSSFLIHNGINIYGSLVCMPHTEAQLQEQGERWARRTRA